MRDDVQGPPQPAVDEYSPTAAPLTPPTTSPPPPATSRPPPTRSAATDVATGVSPRVEDGVDTLVGTVLADRYRIDRRLGAGGMGAVYAGFHLSLDKRIALKVIQPRLGADPTIAQRFVQEARAASAIGHEHIVQITDFGRTDAGAAFIVMEYLEGEDLAETLRREGPLPWRRVVHIGEQIAWALAAAHRQGIVHRDIKPANCYRVPREHDEDFIKVLDFGLAKVRAQGQRDGESLTGTGMLLGTPGYIAPELYRGLKADHRVDIYALGALMHKLLTGELPPMASGSAAARALQSAAAPGAVLAVLGRAIAESPDDRHATAQELAQALRAIPRVSVDEPTALARDESAPPRHEPTPASRDPSSAGAVTLREPTSSTFPSLFTVEHDGHRVRFHVGTPLIVLVLGLLGGLVWYMVRAPAVAPPAVVTNTDTAPLAPPAAPLPAAIPLPVAAPPGPIPTPADGPGSTPADAPTGSAPAPADVPPGSAPAPADVPPGSAPAPADAPPGSAPTPPVASSPPGPQPPWPPAPDAPAPKDMSPETAPPPPAKRSKGSSRALTAYLNRRCSGGLLSFVVDLSWQTDAEGLVVADSVAGKPGDDRDITRCSLRELRASRFVWRPTTRYRERLTLGGPAPAPP